MSEPAEGARLLSEYTGLNLYREFKSLPLRHIANKTAKLSDDNLAVFAFKKGVFLASTWGSTPKTALHQRRGQAPSKGSFSDRFLNNSPSISAAQYAHPQAVIFEVAEAIRSPLNQLHFSMETFCNAVIPSKTEHSGHFFPPIMQRLAQGAQRREGCFSKLINFIQ